MRTLIVIVAFAIVLLRGALAQDSSKVRVDVRVTAVSGGSIYLDKGRSAGLEVGDRITFFPAGSSSVEGTIRSVTKNSARAEADPGSAPVVPEDRGEVLVPKERIATPTQPAPGAQDKPGHPPWTQPPENWSSDKPLLAPAFGIPPDEREPRFHGRFYVQGQGTWDNQGGSRKFLLGSTGLDATLDNPFGRGGALRLDAQLFSRSTDSDGFHDDETRFTLRRFAYEEGGTQDRPNRWQVGRFLQHEFPELGLLDGLEWSRRTAGGSRFGASVGAMPEPFPELKSFDDVQAAIFYRHAFDEKQRNTAGIAYQNTWHKGEQDRNLVVGTTDLRPSDRLTLHASTWLDSYGANDTIKDQGIELTEFSFSSSWRATNASGLGLSLSHRRFPELLRNEFTSVSATSIKDNKVDRAAVNGWWNATERLRFDGRVDHWRDQDDDGSTGEVGGALRDVLWDQGELRASFFYADGSFSSGPGFRVQASKAVGRAYASLGYEFVSYDQKDFVGNQQTLGQHSIFGSLDIPIAERIDLSLLGEDHFGDEQDSYTLGFMVQTRF